MDAKHNKSIKTLKISGNWSKQANDLKEKFTQLTNSDLKFEKERELDLIKRKPLRLRKKREKIIKIIKKGQPTTT